MLENAGRTLLGSCPHIYSTRSFAASLKLECDLFALPQSVKIDGLESAAVEEDLLTVFAPDEPEASVPDKPLNCTLHDEPRSH
jgi:hypothetical protein